MAKTPNLKYAQRKQKQAGTGPQGRPPVEESERSSGHVLGMHLSESVVRWLNDVTGPRQRSKFIRNLIEGEWSEPVDFSHERPVYIAVSVSPALWQSLGDKLEHAREQLRPLYPPELTRKMRAEHREVQDVSTMLYTQVIYPAYLAAGNPPIDDSDDALSQLGNVNIILVLAYPTNEATHFRVASLLRRYAPHRQESTWCLTFYKIYVILGGTQ